LSNRTRRRPQNPPQLQSLEGRTLLSGVPHFDHIVVVIEENKSPTDVIGSNEAPYINSLAQTGAYLSQSYGTDRPSQPNYIALFSGSNQGVSSNSDVNLGNIPNLGSQLIASGKSFVEFSEDLPYVGFTGSTSGRYARKHNPSVSFSNVPAASNRPFTDFPGDFTKLPSVSFVVPNLDNDSHDGTVDTSDQWLEDHMSGYAQWAKAHNSLLVVTYDEGNGGDATNHMTTILYGAEVKAGTYSNRINHYNVLRTIEDSFGLAPLANAADAAPIDYVFDAATPPPGGIAAPSDLTATAVSGTEVDLHWADQSDNETLFKIERSTDGRTFSPLAASGANFTSYKNGNLTAGKKYYYRIYAINGSGRSDFSNVAFAVTTTGTTPPPPPTAPAAPSGLGASAVSSSQINLTWADHADNETGYRVERGTDGVNFSLLTTLGVNATSYSNSGLSASTKYYYRVLALGNAGNSGFSNVAGVTTQSVSQPPPPGAPAAPTDLVATSISGTQIVISWADHSDNETLFKIERSTDGRTFSPLAASGANFTSYKNGNLTAGKHYYYRVYAINGSGRSAFTNVADAVAGGTGQTPPPTVPGAPSGLAASAASASQINLSWADNSTNETGFRIERSTDGTTWGLLTTVGANVKVYSNTGLSASTKYYYRVLAVGGSGNSGWSHVASATTQAVSQPPPGGLAAPTNLVLSKSTSVANAINLSWTDHATTETTYKIERSTDGKNFSPLAGGGANMAFYRNTSLTAGKRYYYRVYCINASGRSGFSNVANLVL
jgi:fibronectin type 3 domain-containing protein